MPERTTTEYALLGLLTAGELSGYDLRKRAEGSVGYFWSPARSQIYAVLPRLEAAGLVTRRDVPQRGKPAKQLYRLTEAGEAELRDWLDHGPAEPPPDRNPLLIKVFFGEYASAEALLEQVRERRAEVEQLRAELEAIGARTSGLEHDFFPELTRRYGLRWADAIATWADDVERALAGRAQRAGEPA
ncbi:MAG: PadR family transcriptional regulator [Gaiellaceae bacterium]